MAAKRSLLLFVGCVFSFFICVRAAAEGIIPEDDVEGEMSMEGFLGLMEDQDQGERRLSHSGGCNPATYEALLQAGKDRNPNGGRALFDEYRTLFGNRKRISFRELRQMLSDLGVRRPAGQARCLFRSIGKNRSDRLNFRQFKAASGVMGDPHIKKWDGVKFDFHGECDLVLATSKHFANGLGLDVHLRTTKLGEYSFSEVIAVRVGNTTLEVHVNPEVGQPQIYLDGKKQPMDELPLQLPVGNLVLSPVEGELVENRQDVLRLHGEEMLDLSYFVTSKKYLSFSLESDHMSDTRGLMGTNEFPSRTLSRNGVDMEATKENQAAADQFGLEWQVKLDDPRLFHEARAPQWPETCIMPMSSMDATDQPSSSCH